VISKATSVFGQAVLCLAAAAAAVQEGGRSPATGHALLASCFSAQRSNNSSTE
jgi:hypothetical protein